MKGFSDVNVKLICFHIKRSAGLLTACNRLRRFHSSWRKKEKPNQSWHSVKDNAKTDRADNARITFSFNLNYFFTFHCSGEAFPQKRYSYSEVTLSDQQAKFYLPEFASSFHLKCAQKLIVGEKYP